MEAGVTCQACGAQNAAGQRFCGSCGSPLARACPRCGAANESAARFCGSCGATLSEPETPAGEGAPFAHSEERKVVSVVFADLVGFTARSDRADPEDVQRILRGYYARARSEIEALGGTVEKFIGDAVVGVFGVPVAHEDDPERAVLAALGVLRAVDELNESDPTLDLSARAAVTTGEAVVTLDARPDAGEGFVAGDVLNTASRLQNVAPVGGVVVGELTYRATRDAFEYEVLEPVTVKGKTQPIPIWLARAAGPRVERPSKAPLVGRSHELSVLSALWEKVAVDRHPHLVTVMGPPGIGKSRLLRELQPRLEQAGRFVKGRCRPYGETTGYGAFGQQVKQVAEIYETDSSAQARQKLDAMVGAIVGSEESREVSEHLAVLLGLSTEGAPDKQVLFYSARRFTEALAAQQPTVLAFEDLHWAEPALLDLIESLASRVREVPLLLMALARPELLDAKPAWGGGLTRYTAVPLEPLGEAEAREMALGLLGSGDPGEPVDRLLDASGGNPLFLEELAASLAERTAEVASGLPTSVQAIIAARLDALPLDQRRVLQDASVIGQIFWRGPLAAISGNGSRLDLSLDSLESRDFIRRQPTSSVAGDREFIFKHVLTREVAYGTLPRPARRQRHASIADYLERAAGDRARESASILAHHWQEAGDGSKAAGYLTLAAQVASRAWAKDQAVTLYSDAITLLEGHDDAERVVHARLGRAETLIDAGQYGQAVETDVSWLLEAASGRTLCLVHLARARAAFWLADATGVRDSSQAALELARELGDDELEGRALVALHEAVAMAGDTQRGKQIFTQALEKWPVRARDRAFARGYGTRSLMSYWTGDYEECLRMGLQAHQMGMELSSVEAAMVGAKNAGLALAGLTRHEEAFEWFRRAVDLGREWEQDRFTARALNMWSGALREVGDLERARELSAEAVDMGTRASFPGAVVSARIDFVSADLMVGDIGAAEAAIPGIVEAVEKTKGWHEWLWSIRLNHARAETALAAGRAEEAAAFARRAFEESLGPHRLKYTCLARTMSGRALLEMGLVEEAERALWKAVEDAERLGHTPSLWPALAGWARAVHRAGREEEAAGALERARDSIEQMAAALSEERRAILRSRPDVAAILGAPRS